MYSNSHIISIDGGCRTSKSRISKELSRILSIPFLDTGLVYRAFSLFWKNNSFDSFFNKPLAFYEERSKVELYSHGMECIIKINGNTIDPINDKHSIDILTSKIAENIPVRLYLTNVIHQFIENKSFIVTGRDIGSFMFPNTRFKIFLYIDYSCNISCLNDKTFQDIKERDERDTNRAFAPLKKEENQLVLNVEKRTFGENVALILSYLQEKGWE